MTVRITAEHAAELGLVVPPKTPKYRNKAKTVDGIRFASGAEAAYFEHLKRLKRAGEVVAFTIQPRFEIQPAYEKHGRKVAAREYVGDFAVTYSDGRRVVVDVKGDRGTVTALFTLKRALYGYLYDDPLVIVTRDGRGWKEHP